MKMKVKCTECGKEIGELEEGTKIILSDPYESYEILCKECYEREYKPYGY